MKNPTQAADPSTLLLSEYEEVTGEILSLRREENYFIISLSVGKIAFKLNTREAGICENKLIGNEGRRISILRVPDREEPLMICFPEDEKYQ